MKIKLVERDSGYLGQYDVYALFDVAGPIFTDDIGERDRELLLSRIHARLFDRAHVEERSWCMPGPDEGRRYSAIRVLRRTNCHGDQIDLPTWMLAGGFGG
ncbi:MAG: hypothetical protein P4L33_04800 [Capsulimonadaceae bacterium]|nr:hypothetical protein [Capsulimonadaceae bacterium]